MLTFNKLNMNPKQIKTGDCVIRALSYALNKPWLEVFDELVEISRKTKRMPNEKHTYEQYLKEQGWIKQKQPKRLDGTKYFVNEIDLLTDGGRVVISCANHMTAANLYLGHLIDIWDCGRKKIGNYWTKERV